MPKAMPSPALPLKASGGGARGEVESELKQRPWEAVLPLTDLSAKAAGASETSGQSEV